MWFCSSSSTVFSTLLDLTLESSLNTFLKFATRQSFSKFFLHLGIQNCSFLYVAVSNNAVALLVGYMNFAEMSLVTKMASSVESVNSMILSMLAGAKTAQEIEMASLQVGENLQPFHLITGVLD
jgi:hypothetical protein